MSKIVLELQRDALESNSDIISLLRKAYLVAKKLKLKKFERWTNNELNGYKNNKVPDYRLLIGEVKGWNPFHGWVPVILSEEEEKEINCYRATDSIANFVDVYNKKNGNAIFSFNAGLNKILSNMVGFETKFALFITDNKIYTIIERVRNVILDWSITLEENGILGENLEFSSYERECAQKNPIIYNYTNNFYGNVNNTQIQQDTKKSIQSKK